MTGNRFREIDVMKGVLILLVVIGHLIPQFAACVESILCRRVFFAIYGFHMQAFVFVAGFCSARLLETLSLQDAGRFLRFRVTRLMTPYLFWGCAYFALRFAVSWQSAFHYDFSRSWQFLIGYNPDGALWFLWALFFATGVAALVLRVFSLGRAVVLSAATAVVALWSQPWLNLPVATNALPLFFFFFCLGLWARAHYDRLRLLIGKGIFGLMAAIGFLAIIALHPISVFDIPRFLIALTSLTGTALLLFIARLATNWTWVSVPWVFLSGYAMEIYILAEPVKVVCRMAFCRLGVSVPVSFAAMLVLMLAVPIIVSRYVWRNKWFSLLLLGRISKQTDGK